MRCKSHGIHVQRGETLRVVIFSPVLDLGGGGGRNGQRYKIMVAHGPDELEELTKISSHCLFKTAARVIIWAEVGGADSRIACSVEIEVDAREAVRRWDGG